MNIIKNKNKWVYILGTTGFIQRDASKITSLVFSFFSYHRIIYHSSITNTIMLCIMYTIISFTFNIIRITKGDKRF